MTKRWFVLVALTSAALGLVACGGAGDDPTADEERGSVTPPGIDAGELEGRIAFMRGDASQEASVTYIVAPDGSGEREVFPEGNSANPTWSPDGTEIHVFCCGDGMVAHFVDRTDARGRTAESGLGDPPGAVDHMSCGRVGARGTGTNRPAS